MSMWSTHGLAPGWTRMAKGEEEGVLIPVPALWTGTRGLEPGRQTADWAEARTWGRR